MSPRTSLAESGAVVVLLYPGCTIAEVIDVSTRLRNVGREVLHVASTDEVIVDASGLTMVPDLGLTQVDSATVGVLVIPGGDPGSIMDDDAVAEFVNAVANSGLVAGICAGVLVMARAGVLAGRKATHNYRAPWAPVEVEQFVAEFWTGVEVEPDPTVGVVTDGRLVTALPGAANEFAVTVATMAGALDRSRADMVLRERRGEHVPELWRSADKNDA